MRKLYWGTWKKVDQSQQFILFIDMFISRFTCSCIIVDYFDIIDLEQKTLEFFVFKKHNYG